MRQTTARRRQAPRRLVRIALDAVLILAWCWALPALWCFASGPGWLAVALAVGWVGGSVAALVLAGPAARRLLAAGVLLAILLWSLQEPSNRRDWNPNQSRMALAEFPGDSEVVIHNFRNSSYGPDGRPTPRWETRRFDLGNLETVEFLVVPFTNWRGPAHTFLTFGFSDGQHVAISVEARRERKETYSPLKGLYRSYEILYVVGSETDLIGSRVDVLRAPVYLYPIRAESQQVRDLFVSMLERANRLAENPEFYNTIGNTCASNIVGHMNELRSETVHWSPRLALPGYSDRVALELGLLDFDGTIEQAREKFLIGHPGGPVWPRAEDPKLDTTSPNP